MITPNPTPSEITVSLEWAEKLQVAGWPQEQSVFYWQWYEDDREWPTWDGNSEWYCDHMHVSLDEYDDGQCYAAPTAEEVLRKLPAHIQDDRMAILRMGDTYGVYYLHHESGYVDERRHLRLSDTLANAAASMFVFLAEQKLLPTP